MGLRLVISIRGISVNHGRYDRLAILAPCGDRGLVLLTVIALLLVLNLRWRPTLAESPHTSLTGEAVGRWRRSLGGV